MTTITEQTKRITLYDNYDNNYYDEETGNYDNDSDCVNFNTAIEIINEYNDNNGFILEGTTRRWNGKITGCKYYKNITELLYDFGKDCDYFKIYIVDDHIELECTHHDGTNYANIYSLNKDGYYLADIYEDFFNIYAELRECIDNAEEDDYGIEYTIQDDRKFLKKYFSNIKETEWNSFYNEYYFNDEKIYKYIIDNKLYADLMKEYINK